MTSYRFDLDGRTSDVVPLYRNGGFDLEIDGRIVSARLEPGDESGVGRLHVDGRVLTIAIATRGDTTYVHLDGRVHEVRFPNALERILREAEKAGGKDTLMAPMPGTVIQVATEEGREVAAGELLMTIESMKLQTAITAPHQARVVTIAFQTGQSFDKGAVLVRLEAVAPQAGADSGSEKPSS